MFLCSLAAPDKMEQCVCVERERDRERETERDGPRIDKEVCSYLRQRIKTNMNLFLFSVQ